MRNTVVLTVTRTRARPIVRKVIRTTKAIRERAVAKMAAHFEYVANVDVRGNVWQYPRHHGKQARHIARKVIRTTRAIRLGTRIRVGACHGGVSVATVNGTLSS